MKKLKELYNLKGKTAVITGGLGHLGTAMSEALLELGANLIISTAGAAAKQKDNLKKIKDFKKNFPGSKISLITLDFQDDSSIGNFFAKIKKDYKSIDVLINNATSGVSKPVESMSFGEFNFGVNGILSSAFKCSQSVLPLMKSRGGVIINIASMYGLVAPDWRIYKNNPYNNPINYGASKAGIIQLTKYLASYWGKYGIRVNSISPGPFPNEKIVKNKEFKKSLETKTMLNRVGAPEDIKGITAFLASGASNYATGQNFIIDGGWTAW